MPQGQPPPVSAPRGMRHRHGESGGIHYGAWGAAGYPLGDAGVQRAGGRPLSRGTGARSPRKPSRVSGGVKPAAQTEREKVRTMRALRERRSCQHQRRTLMPQGKPVRHSEARGRVVPDREKARTMRALRERPRHHQRRTLMPQGQPPPVSAPRGMRHRHSESGGIHYGGLGRSPSGGVQRAGGRPLPRGSGARSPRKPSRGAGRVAPESPHGARGA